MNFDTLAPHYDWLEAVLAGHLLQDCRIAYPHVVRRAKTALLVGEGHGRFLEWCLRHADLEEITCIDASGAMLERSRMRSRGRSSCPTRIHFIRSDVMNVPLPSNAFDLAATHFFLDCFPARTLPAVVAHIGKSVKPGCAWLISDFCIPADGWQRARARGIHWLMYRFFRVAAGLRAARITPPDAWLSEEGFDLVERRTGNKGLLHADHWRKAGGD